MLYIYSFLTQDIQSVKLICGITLILRKRKFLLRCGKLPKYKHGKITTPIDFKTFKECMENPEWKRKRRGFNQQKIVSYKSFLAFLYWFGIRKSEVLSLTKNDFDLKDGLLIVDVKAKKRGHREPLEIPIGFPYVNIILIHLEGIEEGRVWRFSPRTAINIVKYVMGDRYYPHFFRLNRATRFLEDSTTTLPEMKAWFGWKSSKSVDPYIGYSRRYIHTQRERLSKELE